MTYSDLRQNDFSFKSSDPIFFKEKILKIQDIFEMQLASNFHSWFKQTIHLYRHNTRSYR